MYYQEIWYFFFPKILFFRHKRKDDLSQKNTYKYDVFFKCSEKMVFPKTSRLNMIFFVISGKMVFLFSRKHIFSLNGKWKKVTFIKKYMEIWYFLYICINAANVIFPFWQTNKDTLVRKKYTSGITEKDDIHPRKYGISVGVPYWLTF